MRSKHTAVAAGPPTPAAAATSTAVDERETAEDRIERFLTEFGGTGAYRVQLERAVERKWAYVGRVEFSDDFLEDVRQQHGRGDYKGRLVNPENRYVSGGTIYFTIASDPDPVAPAPPPTAASPATAVPLTGPVNSVEQLQAFGIMSLLESFQNSNKVTAAMIERVAQPPKSIDWVPLITAVMPLFLELLKGSRSKAATAEEIAAAIGAKRGGVNPSEILGAVREMLEISESLGGRADARTDPVMLAIQHLGPILAKAFADSNAAAPAQTVPIAAPATTIAPGESVSTEPEWAAQLRPHVEQLVRVAASGKDGGDFAHTVLTYFMPETHKGTLRELLAQENHVEQITAAFPALAAYPTWLEDFCYGASLELGLVDEDDTPPAPTTNGAGPRSRMPREVSGG